VKINGKTASPRRADKVAVSSEPDLERLARLICAYAPHDGTFELRIPGLHASRFSRINTECAHVLRLPSLCIIAQGAKTVSVGQEAGWRGPPECEVRDPAEVMDFAARKR
jgi:hypothetical protein